MKQRAKVLVTGASGFIGRNLVPVLLDRGKSVRLLVRKPIGETQPGTEKVIGDLLKPGTLQHVFDGIDTAYYLVHSMSEGVESFRSLDMQAANNFVKAADDAGVRRVIYLSGLGEYGKALSRHLTSREEVASILEGGHFLTTTLRAAIIIGAGGASFELICYLVRTQPFLLDTTGLDNHCQPIALADVLHYLVSCLDENRTAGGTFDICGPEVLSYRQLLEKTARLAGTFNLFIPAPAMPSRMISRWVGLFSRLDRNIVEALLEGLGTPVVCSGNQIERLIPHQPLSLDDAIQKALIQG